MSGEVPRPQADPASRSSRPATSSSSAPRARGRSRRRSATSGSTSATAGSSTPRARASPSTPLTGWYRAAVRLGAAGRSPKPASSGPLSVIAECRIPPSGGCTQLAGLENRGVLLRILGRLTMLQWSPRLVALVVVLALVVIARRRLGRGAHATTCTGKRRSDSAASCRRRGSSPSSCPVCVGRLRRRVRRRRRRSRSRRTDRRRSLGLAALLVASTLADRFPVPVEGVDAGGVSLSFVFGVAAIVLFGWAAGADRRLPARRRSRS